MPRGLVLADIKQITTAPERAAATARFEQWVDAYQARVARLAQRLLGWRADVDDIVQDVFLAALHRADSFRGDASPWTWLAAITINRCRQHIRRAAFLRRIGLAWWLEKKNPAPAAEEVARDGEVHRRVREAIFALPEKEREVVVLYYLEQFSVAEIAAMLKLSVNAVDVRLHRARAKLKNDLADVEKD